MRILDRRVWRNPRLRSRIDAIVALGIRPGMLPPHRRRQVQTVTVVSAVVWCVAVAVSLQAVSVGAWWASVAARAILLLAVLNLVMLSRRHLVDVAGQIVVALFLGLLVIAVGISGGLTSPWFGTLYLVPLVASIVANTRTGWRSTGLVLAAVGGFGWLEPGLGAEVVLPRVSICCRDRSEFDRLVGAPPARRSATA